MHAGELRGLNDLLVGAILEPADVGRDRIGEQLDVLRQIAEVTAEESFGQVETSAPSRRTAPVRRVTSPNELAGKGGFAGSGWPDDAKDLAGLDAERNAAQDRLVAARAGRTIGLDRKSDRSGGAAQGSDHAPAQRPRRSWMRR